MCNLIQDNKGKLGTEIMLGKRFILRSSEKEIIPCTFFSYFNLRIGIILQNN